MVKIRLKRMGYKRNPIYRIVVLNSTTKRETAPIQQLGHYNPKTKEMVLDKKAALDWISKGAQPTETVQYLINNCDDEGKLVYKQKTTQKLSKKAQAKLAAEKDAKEAAAAKAKEEAAKAAEEAATAAAAPKEEAAATEEEAVTAEEVETPTAEAAVEETKEEAEEEETAAEE